MCQLSEILCCNREHFYTNLDSSLSHVLGWWQYGNNGHSIKYPVTFQYRVHTRVNSDEDDHKQKAFQNVHQREKYLVSLFFGGRVLVGSQLLMGRDLVKTKIKVKRVIANF